MAISVGEADHLVFDGRTIPRPHALDDPGVHGRFVEIGPDDVMRLLVGVSHPARHLFHVELSIGPTVQAK
ncbi:MAG: hypothetical protein RLZZ486_541, partial [Actinomycetota bacterium]